MACGQDCGPGVGVCCVGRGTLLSRAPGSEPRCSLLFPDHPYLEPRHFVDEKAVNENHKDYMFLECILFITEVSRGGEGEVHSSCRLKCAEAGGFGQKSQRCCPEMAGLAPEGRLLKRRPRSSPERLSQLLAVQDLLPQTSGRGFLLEPRD